MYIGMNHGWEMDNELCMNQTVMRVKIEQQKIIEEITKIYNQRNTGNEKEVDKWIFVHKITHFKEKLTKKKMHIYKILNNFIGYVI